MQIVGFDRRVGGEPAAILLARDDEVTRTALSPGTHLEMGLGTRHCAGTVDGDRHVSCERATAPYCEVHTTRWPCARCTGDCAMPLEDCHEEHAIYLAAFAPDVFKVGVTKSWRLETRLEEQGAEKAAHVRTVENGRKAREIEAEMARDLTDRVQVSEKIAGLHHTVDDARWKRLLDRFDVLGRFEFEYDLGLDRQPVQETLAAGDVVGAKGRIAVIENGGTTYAVDMRSLVGHEVVDDSDEAERQASLGAF